MDEMSQTLVTVDDFDNICRVCLRSNENMVDIFEWGIDNQLMEITKLKVTLEDKLPQALCLNCRLQMDHLSQFLEKAKSSDIYLRSLLSSDNGDKAVENIKESLVDKVKSPKTKSQKVKRKTQAKKPKREKKANKESESNKIYLIVVPEADNNSQVESEICIKDLSMESDNSELDRFCQTLVHDYIMDGICPKECKGSKEAGSVKNDENSSVEPIGINSRPTDCIYNVNLVIFQCTECQKAYEEQEDLSNHYSLEHNGEISLIKFFYVCPACKYSEIDKCNFLNHLKDHKEKEGFQFLKVNSSGEPVPLNDIEENLFVNLTFKSNRCCNVFKLNLDIFNCKICFAKVESQELIAEHLKSCHPDEQFRENVQIWYDCPVCNVSFFDDKNNFIQHLTSHREEKIYFIKVNCVGDPLKLMENEEIFVSCEEATEFMKVFNNSVKIFEITNVNSCDKCDYAGRSFSCLKEHYREKHLENVSSQLPLSCPVCSEEFNSGDVDETKTKLYDHLKIHKKEGHNFVEMNKNGSVSSCAQEYSVIFSQSALFGSWLNGSLCVDKDRIWCPEFVIYPSENLSGRQRDSHPRRKQFKRKNEDMDRLKSQIMKKMNRDGSNYSCEKCGKKFAGKKNYIKHFLKHAQISDPFGKRRICAICNRIFANGVSLSNHVKNHAREGVDESSLPGITCEKCGRSFSNRTSLTKHEKVHGGGKENAALKCEICNRKFFRQSSFDRHISAHSNPKYFDCDVCKLPFSSMATLRKHSKLHGSSSSTHDCKTCKTSFLTGDSLTAHQTHTGHYLDRKPFECNVCHEKFFIGRKFTEHVKTHPKYKMGECSLCGKRLSTVQSLTLHMRRHFDSNSILCPHCGKRFFEQRNYHRHLLTHEGVKPHGCDVEGCDKSFYTPFELNRHKKYHSNTRDFRCPHCSKCFHEANHLTVHVRTHTGERPYECPHCDRGFVTRTRCKHHIKMMHQGVGYDLIRTSICKKVAVFEKHQSFERFPLKFVLLPGNRVPKPVSG